MIEKLIDACIDYLSQTGFSSQSLILLLSLLYNGRQTYNLKSLKDNEKDHLFNYKTLLPILEKVINNENLNNLDRQNLGTIQLNMKKFIDENGK